MSSSNMADSLIEKQMASAFWRLAFLDQVHWRTMVAHYGLEEDLEPPASGLGNTQKALRAVILRMLASGYPFDDLPFETFWPVIVREVEPFGVDAEAVRRSVEEDMEDDLAENREILSGTDNERI